MQSDEVITCDHLKAWGITFLISYGYRHIITPDVIEYCQGRAINLHIAYLPWNRGAEPNLLSFIEGTPKGVTIHALDRGVDTGAILCQQQVDFSEQRDWTLATTYQHLHTVLQQLFKQHWPDIKAGHSGAKAAGQGSYHRVRDFDPFRAQLHSGWIRPSRSWLLCDSRSKVINMDNIE